jgi:hypothetical protein
MANRFWVGGSGTWNTTSTANWATTTGGASGASAPTTADIAIFDANSGSTYTVTLGENVTIQTLTANAAVGLTLNYVTYKVTVTGNNANVYRANGVIEYQGTPVVDLTYSGATGTRTIAPGSATVTNPPQFNITAGSDTVSLSAGSIGRYGTLNFTGFSGTLVSASSTANWTIFGDLVLSSTMTMPSQTGAFVFSATSGTQQITSNGKTINQPLTFSGVGGTFAFQDALTQGSTRAFTITNGTVQLKNGVTSTVGSFVASNANVKFLQSTTPGSQATLSQASGTVNVVDLTIQDINAVGGASWNAYTDFENTDAGNNDGWNFSLSPPYSIAELPVTLRPFTQPRRF